MPLTGFTIAQLLGLSIDHSIMATGGSSSSPLPINAERIFSNNQNDSNRNKQRRSQSIVIQKLLRNARRLEDGANDDGGNDAAAEENMEAFLMDYSIKFMKCLPDQVLTDADYNDHFGVVIFRMCPANQCSNDNGCKSGYADFAIDVGTYVNAFFEDQQDNMNWDDNFDGEGFGQCNQYNVGDDDGGDIDYYIGPGCTEDGLGVKMGLYEDKYCYQESETSFETISNGWSLPYNDGGLVSTKCIDCTEDDGALRDLCLDMYDYAQHRCESNIEYTHYYYDTNFEIYRYGKDETGCTSIDVMQNPRSKFSNGVIWTDAVLVVILLIGSVVGFYYYSIWWKKQKEDLEKIDDDEDDSQYRLDGDDDDDDYSGVSGSRPNDSSAVNESTNSPVSPIAAEQGTLA